MNQMNTEAFKKNTEHSNKAKNIDWHIINPYHAEYFLCTTLLPNFILLAWSIPDVRI